ncbi:alpha-galactosidase A precursor [Annulohypoxylon maeteangense]|uniref:alpha-galactosidase A precursor n=1 Tax=Annulohypoxylon maeteangense TaxID=1927788 RepID=UPI002008E13F|nr:alpha-galactosidase A precursor [Annulohypoxylon maeteangense]KAI0883943.1 alpha-galactosidase A precursor [Annulohypoxylon maeteangense]
MAHQVPNIKLLHASVDPDNKNESEVRILIDNKFVKYINIDPGVYDPDDMCFEPVLISLLPPLPSEDWNTGYISQNAETGIPHFSVVSNAPLPGITNTWHPTQVDHLEIRERQRLRSNVCEVECPGFSSPVVAKFARFEWEIPQMRAETAAYEWIAGQDIGPSFLGHLTEEGRVIGFLIEYITNFRHATLEDLPLCQSTLSKLHKLGITHGDTNKHNILIHDGKATLIDFDFASRSASDGELEAELHGLPEQLRDMSGRGGRRMVVETDPQ